MWLKDGKYDSDAPPQQPPARSACPARSPGLHLAWKEHGKLPWKRLVDPAIELARDGFAVTDGLARSLAAALRRRLQEVPGVGRAVLARTARRTRPATS